MVLSMSHDKIAPRIWILHHVNTCRVHTRLEYLECVLFRSEQRTASARLRVTVGIIVQLARPGGLFFVTLFKVFVIYSIRISLALFMFILVINTVIRNNNTNHR